MQRPRPVIVALAVVVVMAAGASAALLTSNPPATATGSQATTTSSTTSSSTSTTTSTTVAPKTTGTGPPTTEPRISDPAQAARRLFDAWQAGDRQRALSVAAPGAVDKLFALDRRPRPRFTACRSEQPGFRCHYAIPNANGVFFIDMLVSGGASAGYRVEDVEAPLRFATPADSARHLMRAWVDDDKAEARKAASEAAVDDLWDGLKDDRDDPPTLAACTPRDAGVDCSWNAKDDTGISMLVVGGASAGWRVESVAFVGD
jgi:hypothetical protein